MIFKNVLIVGGTHGNERTGIALVNKWEQDAAVLRRSTVSPGLLLANPRAVESNTRYLDQDLNRCFDPVDLADTGLPGYENRRARELVERFRPNGVARYDLILDLHTSTANMGVTLITDTNPVNLKLAYAARCRLPRARIYAFGPETRIHASLRALARHAIGVEIGPVPQGVLRHDILERTEETVAALLDVVDTVNVNGLSDAGEAVEVFQHVEAVLFPRSADGRLQAVVHKDLEGRDYKPLRPGDPIFWKLDDTVLTYDGGETVYPVFINEAAYYVNGTAFSLTRKARINV